MISEEVELRLMRYFFEQTATYELYTELPEALMEYLFRDEDYYNNEDRLVEIGVQLINKHLDLHK